MGFFQPLHGQVEILLSTLDIVLRQTVIGLAIFVFFLGYQVVFKKLAVVLKYASYLLKLQLGCINLSLLLLDFDADVLVVQCKEQIILFHLVSYIDRKFGNQTIDLRPDGYLFRRSDLPGHGHDKFNVLGLNFRRCVPLCQIIRSCCLGR